MLGLKLAISTSALFIHFLSYLFMSIFPAIIKISISLDKILCCFVVVVVSL